MKKQMKIILVILAIISTTTIMGYAVQPESPSLPVLVQNIYDIVFDIQANQGDTVRVYFIENIIPIQGPVSGSNYGGESYSELRHVELTVWIDPMTNVENEKVYLRSFAPGLVTKVVKKITPDDQTGEAFTIEFVTRSWHFQCFSDDNANPAYNIRYTAKITHVD